MTITVTGSHGNSVSIDLSASRNMMIAKQLSDAISTISNDIEKYEYTATTKFTNPDTISLMAGTTTMLPSTSVHGGTSASLFIVGAGASTVAGSSTLASLGNSTLEGAFGKLTLAQGIASLNGGLAKDVIDFVSGKAPGAQVLVDFTKAPPSGVKIDIFTPGQATGGTTITLSDATKITFQAATLHTPTIH